MKLIDYDFEKIKTKNLKKAAEFEAGRMGMPDHLQC
jgi:hypothetical protein